MADTVRTLIDDYLESARRLETPVARFSAAHDSGSLARVATERAQLIPLSVPAANEQFAFEVDLDACHGCKACVAACHSLNGLDEEEAWRDVGLVFGGTSAAPYQQTITTACHHCAEPGCLEGCPVLAYEKDGITGIVRHLDDQCIGCQYCILKCPYDVPKYNARLGIVRKCDMCHQRLAEGEAPACAQACPTHAIRIVKVSRSTSEASVPADQAKACACGGDSTCGCGENAQQAASQDGFLSAAPAPDYTRPTTRYVSRLPLPGNLRPADWNRPRPQHAHLSLIVMLTLTQAGYGLLLSERFNHNIPAWLHPTGLALILVGLIASITHLGQPLRAWRIFLGLRRSWLSREAVLLGASFGLLLGLEAWPLLASHLPASLVRNLTAMLPIDLPRCLSVLWDGGLTLGLAGVVCSAMIYVDTHRLHWRPFNTFLRMGGTLLCFALAPCNTTAAACLLLLKLAGEALAVLPVQTTQSGQLTARLHREYFSGLCLSRLAAALGAACLLLSQTLMPALVLLLAGELLERTLFFTTVDAPKMPGNP